MSLVAVPAVEQQPYTREPIEARVQRERDQAIEGEWRQIDRVLRVLATTVDAIVMELRAVPNQILTDRAAAITAVEQQTACVAEVAVQLRTARVSPEKNQERKAAEAQR